MEPRSPECGEQQSKVPTAITDVAVDADNGLVITYR